MSRLTFKTCTLDGRLIECRYFITVSCWYYYGSASFQNSILLRYVFVTNKISELLAPGMTAVYTKVFTFKSVGSQSAPSIQVCWALVRPKLVIRALVLFVL